MDETAELAQLLKVLNHPARRRILSVALSTDAAVSPKELAELIDMPLSHTSYHVRHMAERDVLRLAYNKPVRGSQQHFYKLGPLSRHPLVQALGARDDAETTAADAPPTAEPTR